MVSWLHLMEQKKFITYLRFFLFLYLFLVLFKWKAIFLQMKTVINSLLPYIKL